MTETKVENCRLFCLGKELKDDLFMYSYDIADEVVMQLMIRKWDRRHGKDRKQFTTNNKEKNSIAQVIQTTGIYLFY